jgi:glycosyltransferase involved in cell wall biosynthesis
MNILLVSLTVPVPATNGHKMRTWSLIRALAAQGHKTTVLCFASRRESTDDLSDLYRVCESVELVPLETESLSSSSVLHRLYKVFHPVPYGVLRFCSKQMRRRIAYHINSNRPDLVVAETAYSMINIPAAISVPVAIDHHNIESLILKRYCNVERRFFPRLYAALEYVKMLAWDKKVCRNADLQFACSLVDREQVLSLCSTANCAVIPNTVELNEYSPTPPVQEPTLLYVGGLDWLPNRDAIEFFVQEIFPSICKEVEGVRFVVAGRNPPAEFERRIRRVKGVELVANARDIRDVFSRAAVFVVPLRIGSGTRLKILEAAAMGKAIVSTSLGAEGLLFSHGKEILVADQPKAFSRGVIDLLNDPAKRAAIGLAARRKLEEAYGFSALNQSLASGISDLLHRRSVQQMTFVPARPLP